MRNFPIYSQGKKITSDVSGTAGGSQVKTTLPAGLEDDIMIWNPGPLDLFINTGGASVAADDNAAGTISMIVPAKEKAPYRLRDTDTHIAAVSSGAAQDFYIYRGEGS
jgi:hypothetical protein